MWLVVMFDLPTKTSKQRKIACRFRTLLLRNGCNMVQYSIYTRHFLSREQFHTLEKIVYAAIPDMGDVRIVNMSDNTYENMLFVKDGCKIDLETPVDLLLF